MICCNCLFPAKSPLGGQLIWCQFSTPSSSPIHRILPAQLFHWNRPRPWTTSTSTQTKQDVANHKVKAIHIELEDLVNYKDLDEEFLRRVTENTGRYIQIFSNAIDELMPEATEPFPDDDQDILMTQRSEEGTENADGSDPHQKMPPDVKCFLYELRGDEEEQILRLAENGDIYNKLALSLAPEIFGHEDIKKALLLLVGAPHRNLKDSMKIRGDIHICLMDDPGVAKSQLLKHIINVASRGVYTTGRGSSGVGLTAAVQKDPVTNEMVLEGEAPVLADMDICAIEEFDEMDESDRTAIHEVLEQQTVSIAKAGITTSLNARTAVLAAANPAWGRYDLRRTPAENIILPPALLTRFDLLWLILERADMDTDLEWLGLLSMSTRTKGLLLLVSLHLNHLSSVIVTRAYISAARKLSPSVPRELEEYIASAYSSTGQEEAKANTPHSYTTDRTLLSILRISAGYSEAQLKECLEEYATLNVWQIHPNTYDIRFIDG